MRRLLVTGGAGFIGGNFVHYWHRVHREDVIVVLDALTYAGNVSTIRDLLTSERMHFVHGDIVDRDVVSQVMHEHEIDTIVHFAAESHVDRSIVAPEAFVRTNVLGTQVLLDAAVRTWKTHGAWKAGVRFHHVSTDEVYGSLAPEDPPFTESTPYAPRSPYAASKAAADHLVRACVHTYALPATISNCSNNYGPYQFPEKLIPLMIVNALDGRALPVYGDGRQVRDWLHVEDHCVAIDRMLSDDITGTTFNVGGRNEQVNIELVRMICSMLDDRFAQDASLRIRFPNCPAASGDKCESLVAFVDDRPGHDRRYAIDASYLESTLGFRPARTMETGLGQTIGWYLDNEPWWRGVMDGGYRAWTTAQYG
jgi:dTDP-glucose 4,6-dehydratase